MENHLFVSGGVGAGKDLCVACDRTRDVHPPGPRCAPAEQRGLVGPWRSIEEARMVAGRCPTHDTAATLVHVDGAPREQWGCPACLAPELELPRAVTVLACAIARGAQPSPVEDPNGAPGPIYSAAEFERVGFAIVGGCNVCHATIAAYNAYPAKTGYWHCEDCIGALGFESVEEFEAFQKAAHG